MIKREIHIFFTALMFYSRIPCPKWVDHSEDLLNKATRYFPLIGWIVGGTSALVFWGTYFILPLHVAVLISMITGILITGAFHEDGFADVCDAFGGGWTKEQILKIMKDSRLGTYGTVGLIFILLMKFLLLSNFSPGQLPLLIFATHALSRFAPVMAIFSFLYVRDDGTGKSKPVGNKISFGELSLAFILAILPLVLLANPLYSILLVIPFLVKFFMMRYFKKWIGGYTGDCLGSIQQVSEIFIYFGAILIQHIINKDFFSPWS